MATVFNWMAYCRLCYLLMIWTCLPQRNMVHSLH